MRERVLAPDVILLIPPNSRSPLEIPPFEVSTAALTPIVVKVAPDALKGPAILSVPVLIKKPWFAVVFVVVTVILVGRVEPPIAPDRVIAPEPPFRVNEAAPLTVEGIVMAEFVVTIPVVAEVVRVRGLALVKVIPFAT